MNFRDVPNLLKFEQFARNHSEDEMVMDCYRRVREMISKVNRPPSVLDFGHGGAPDIVGMKESCAAVEKSTRLLWACAAATGNIRPPIWQYVPDYEASIEYFMALEDLELMAVTKLHRIAWEEIHHV
jgi:hypothetical protein